jgi:hypothetical protein
VSDEEVRRLARRLWALYEPIHAVVYFHPTALSALEAAGLRGFWRGYFAQRAAPLGRVGEAAVRAAFFGFAPAMTARALPSVWELAGPEQALAARLSGAGRALQEVLPDSPDEVKQLTELADELFPLTTGLPGDGKVLGAANAVLPAPDDPYQRLWQATSTLREHRGDGHVAALVGVALTGLEALVLRGAADLDRQVLQTARGWTDEEWAAAAERLLARDLLSADGDTPQVSAAGRRVLAEVEYLTDRLAWDGWERAGGTVADARRLLHQLHRPAVACRAVLPGINPIGIPQIDNP